MFRSGVINPQIAVCTEEFGIHHAYIILINRGGTTTAPPLLLFEHLAKRSRVFNSRVTEQAAADSAHTFARSIRWTQPTLLVRRRPAAHSLVIAGG